MILPPLRAGGGGVAEVGVVDAPRAEDRREASKPGTAVALYLVVHAPSDSAGESVRPPTRLRELAEASALGRPSPRWLKTWSPDLHDDRIFTLWEAQNADEVRSALTEFGFLDDMDATPLRVREWGPEDVLSATE